MDNKTGDPPKKSLEYMQAHLKDWVRARAGRTVKLEPELELDRQVEQAELVFTSPVGT